jgi:molybdate transport system substrate-binding protein
MTQACPKFAVRRWLLVATFIAGAMLMTACDRSKAGPTEIKVAAASDLAFAFKEIGQVYGDRTGHKVTFTFGSTGLLARQIEEGAPFDVFAAANVSFVDGLVGKGAAVADSKALYGRGRIVVWTKKDAANPPASLSDLADLRFTKIAIANPEHAPYGRAAQQAMVKAGVWDKVKGRIVYGENVQQTLQFAQTGNVEAAIVALSLALVSDGKHVVVEDSLHDPIDQALVVCARSSMPDVARDFANFVNSEDGRNIMKRYGFLLPGESVATKP